MLPIMRFKPICLIALLLLAAGVLGCTAAEPAAKPVDRPAGIESTSQRVPAEPGTRSANSSRQYPKLDGYLNKLIADGEVPESRYVKEGYIPDKSVGVSVDLSGDIETVAAWLESKGISRQDSSGRDEWEPCRLAASSYCIVRRRRNDDNIWAYLALDLLPPLSQQPGVARVRAIEPYPNLNRELRELAVDFDDPLEPAEGIAARAELHPATQHVFICLSGEHDTVIDWLESNRVYADRRPAPPSAAAILSRLATIRAKRPDRPPPNPEFASLLEQTLATRPEPLYDAFTATVPVSLLGDLSMQKGVHRVRFDGCEGTEGPINGRGHPCYTPGGCIPPFAVIRGLGQSETFLLFTNVVNPPGVRLDVDYEGGKGKLAIGSCLDENSSTSGFGHGDSITISGCSAGDAQLRLYRGDDLLESYDIAVISQLD